MIFREYWRWLRRILVIVFVASVPAPAGDLELSAMAAVSPCPPLHPGAASRTAMVEHGRTLEELAHARAWNARLAEQGDARAAMNHEFLSTEEVLRHVDALAPLLACVAQAFGISPALLAGLLAAELDLDYHQTDVVMDWLIATGWADALTLLDINTGRAGVHIATLKPALATMGSAWTDSPLVRTYAGIVGRSERAQLMRLASRSVLFDLCNAAAVARYYALLRMDGRPLTSMTLPDMAFVWAAYRGGVADTAADHGPRVWSLANLRRAEDPYMLGDTLLALPYFSHYQEVFA